jgi:hypothetical protein
MKATVDEKANTLTIVIDLQPPTRSASGKTLVVASTHGNLTVPETTVQGRPLTIGLNAYIRA